VTPAEAIIAEAGGFLVLGEVVYLVYLAIKRNYLKGSFSLGITAPDGRFMKPSKETPRAVPEPVTETAPLHEAGAA
jgi:hypothetical protein